MNILQYKPKPEPAICISCGVPFNCIKPHHKECSRCFGYRMIHRRIVASLKFIEGVDANRKDRDGGK